MCKYAFNGRVRAFTYVEIFGLCDNNTVINFLFVNFQKLLLKYFNCRVFSSAEVSKIIRYLNLRKDFIIDS